MREVCVRFAKAVCDMCEVCVTCWVYVQWVSVYFRCVRAVLGLCQVIYDSCMC